MNIVHTLTVHSERATGLLDVILAASADHVYLFDQQGCYLYASPSACRALNRSAGDLIGHHWSEIGFPAEVMVQFDRNREQVMATGQSITAETMFPLPDKDAYFEYVLTPVRGESGDVEMVVCNAWDITQRRLAEQSLRESEERFRLLVEGAINHAIYTLDVEGYVTTWNAGACRIKGYRHGEIVGQHFSRFYTDEDRAQGKPERALRIAVDEGRYEEIGWRVRKGGRRFQADVVITPMYGESGELKGFSKVTRDVSDRVELERRLNEQLALLQGIIDNAPSMILITDPSDRYLLVNPSLVRHLALQPEATLEDATAEFFGPEFQARLKAGARAVTKTGDPCEFEVTLDNPEGPQLFIVNQFPLRGDEGYIWAVCSIATDITNRKRAEEEIKTLNQTLEASVTELRSVNEELEAFSYSVSHDLRTPLRAIDGFSRLLVEEYRQSLDETGCNYLERLCAASQRMGQLIDDLLMLSRITRSELNCINLDLGAMARDILADLKAREPKRRIDVHIADGMTSYGDKRLIKIALENLLGNAWKFTGRRRDAWIEVSCARAGGETVYRIRDNGVGFDMEYAWQLFKPFRRLSTEVDFDGSGIGLATVQRVIQRHGGRVWADGLPDNGAAFYFTLDISKDSQGNSPDNP